MEKNTLLGLGILGALGVGAYLYFMNKNGGLGGAGAGGGGPDKAFDSGLAPIYNFNIGGPSFPDLSSFFNDTPMGADSSIAPSKNTASTANGYQVFLPGSNEPYGNFAPGSKVIVPVINTIPNTKGGQNFPTVVVPTSKKTTAPYTPTSAQAPLQIQNVFGFPVVPHLSTATPTKKATISIPSTGNKAALITTGTPAQQIEQYNTAPRIIGGKKVM